MLLFFALCLLVCGTHAVTPCSGNGIPYTDAPFSAQGCRCFQGFSGASCSVEAAPGWTIDDGGGNPVLFQEFWLNESWARADLTTRSFYHTPYAPCSFDDTCVYTEASAAADNMRTKVGQAVFALHRAVGNVDPTGYSLVFGAGATEMISALSWAASRLSSEATQVFAAAPYYGGYQSYASGMQMSRLEWNAQPDASQRILEFVTHPNNPDGDFRSPAFSKSLAAYDLAYFWPSLVNISAGGAPLTEDVMIFTLSKLTGYAGTRFGWALVKDPALAQKMQDYMSLSHLHNSQDANARALLVINQLLDDTVRETFFSWVKERLSLRVQQLASALPGYITSLGKLPFYSWLQCSDGRDCAAVMRSVDVTPYPGSAFGVNSSYVRLENVLAEPVWQELLKRLRRLQ